jgi:putative DNA primase/helicase
MSENATQIDQESPTISLQDQIINEAQNHPGAQIPNIAAAEEIAPRSLDWAGKCPYVPVGKITVLAGYPGVGKTAIAISFAAEVTSRDARNVIYITHEDSPADTLIPHFKNASGNTKRLFFCDGSLKLNTQGVHERIDRRVDHTDLEILAILAEVAKPKLIVFDPLDPLYHGLNVNRERAARLEIEKLALFARRIQCAILFVTHLNRRSYRAPMEQIRDNHILNTAARSILLAGELVSEPNAYAMVHIKCNVTERGPSLKYRIEDGAFDWHGHVDVNADQVLPLIGKDSCTPGIRQAKEFLVEQLRHGPVNVEDIKLKAQCSMATLNRAKASLGVSSMKSKTANGQWYWCLRSLTPKADLLDYYEV